MNPIKEDIRGMVTVESSIWIPFLCIVILGVITMLFQWTELGIAQGELLVHGCHVVTQKQENKIESTNPNMHFLKNAIWEADNGKKVWKEVFTANLQQPFKKKVTRKIKIEIENPIKKIRRREKIGETIQEIGLP
ncbi:MAG: hypothetical protein IAC13_05365 [Firmicutes bacterium]|uniref:TadE-like protein n=1 Tax=Candidatus Scybalomonas excrementavium TaxID=2840943 RepID=A0A9D9I155_9FIRM|nr:hypothetical protein [Candidatus Scybalomonas excrementavium]